MVLIVCLHAELDAQARVRWFAALVVKANVRAVKPHAVKIVLAIVVRRVVAIVVLYAYPIVSAVVKMGA